jgi:hypothetical protein
MFRNKPRSVAFSNELHSEFNARRARSEYPDENIANLLNEGQVLSAQRDMVRDSMFAMRVKSWCRLMTVFKQEFLSSPNSDFNTHCAGDGSAKTRWRQSPRIE